MTKLVANGASLKCGEGTSSAKLTVLSTNGTGAAKKPTATVDDYTAMVNVGSFGMCKTQSNPQVAAATSAAQGVLTPMPCVPVITSPWSPGTSSVTISGHDALTDDSKCNCTWSGSIEITDPASDIEVA